MSTCRAIVATLVLASFLSVVSASDWSQWRGPTRDGVFEGPTWPANIGPANLKRLWRVELGHGYPGPIVTKDRVFTVETRSGREVVRAFDRKTGEQLWKHGWKGSMTVPFFAWSNGSWVRSTPAWDGQHLYVGGMRDVLECIDGATGESVWRKDFVAELETPLPAFGLVCSPLVVGDHLYVQAGASIVKLDKRSGDIVWRALEDKGGMHGSAFSSPILAELAGTKQIVVQTRTTLAGLDPETGDVLWSTPVKAFRGMNILTPTVHNDAVFTSTYGGGTELYNISADGDAFRVTKAWRNKLQGYMTSPVIHEGHAYLHLRNQRFACVRLDTGDIAWTSEQRFGKYCSLLLQDDRILALDQKGELLLIRATPDAFDLLARHKVADDSTWAHLAMADQQLFIRELKALAVYEWK